MRAAPMSSLSISDAPFQIRVDAANIADKPAFEESDFGGQAALARGTKRQFRQGSKRAFLGLDAPTKIQDASETGN